MSTPVTLQERHEAAARIAAEPHFYHICLGCEAIADHFVWVCPACHSYRWEDDPDQVRAHALTLGDREAHSVTLQDLMG